MIAWLPLFPFTGLGWWLLGFPFGGAWVGVPMIPLMPVSMGMLVALAAVVFGLYGGLAWVRTNI